VEDLRPEQLHFLEEIGLWSYDPSVSFRVTPPIIVEHCRVPFSWRLVSFHYVEMSMQEVEDFVFQSCADGASGVTTNVAETMCSPERVEQVHAFIRAGKECKRRLFEELVEGDYEDGYERLTEGEVFEAVGLEPELPRLARESRAQHPGTAGG
jgi:hypothetical protein